jgi:branched-chain amino acid transport system ATP-binding protein
MIGEPENDIALQLESVTVAFGGIVAVNNISIIVPRGMRGTIIGPNGAGKTTLFRTISGETLPTKGQIHLFGKNITKWPPFRRARFGIGRTYQVTNIFNDLTVEQNVTLAALAVTANRYMAWLPIHMAGDLAQCVDKALADVRIEGLRSYPANVLSHGQQRQLELAIAMVSNPKLLLLDEPAAGLTSSERKMIVELISNLPNDITVLIIEHDLDLAFGLSERIICMNYGQVIADGTPDEIRRNSRVQEVYMGTG